MFTEQDVRDYWVLGDGLYPELPILVELVNVVEAVLGRSWIDNYTRGTDTYLGRYLGCHSLNIVVRLGALLAPAQRVPGVEGVISRLRRSLRPSSPAIPDFSSAWSELRAINPFLGGGCQAEFKPQPMGSAPRKRADFVVRLAGDQLVCEVTCPTAPIGHHLTGWAMNWLDSEAPEPPPGYRLEIEVDAPLDKLQAAEVQGQMTRERAAVDAGVPLPEPPDGFLASLKVRRELIPGGGVSLTARTSDYRGRQVVEKEAAQLPVDVPSLVIVDTSVNVDANTDWPRSVREWFSGAERPAKPSAVWFIGEMITPQGLTRPARPMLAENPHGVPLPVHFRDLILAVV